MRFELFVALRYLFARRKQAFIYIISAMSVLGVAIGVAALVVVLGVYNGFTTDIRDKILGANAHIIVSGSAGGAHRAAFGCGLRKNARRRSPRTLRHGGCAPAHQRHSRRRRLHPLPLRGRHVVLPERRQRRRPAGYRPQDRAGRPDHAGQPEQRQRRGPERFRGGRAARRAHRQGTGAAPRLGRGQPRQPPFAFRTKDHRRFPAPHPSLQGCGHFPDRHVRIRFVARVHLPCGGARSAGPAFRSDFRHRGHRQGRIQGRYRGRRPPKGARPAGFRPDMDGYERQSLRCVEARKNRHVHPAGDGRPHRLLLHRHHAGHAGHGKDARHRHPDVHGRDQGDDPPDLHASGHDHRRGGHLARLCARHRAGAPPPTIPIHQTSTGGLYAGSPAHPAQLG